MDRRDANGVRRVADCALPPSTGGYLVNGGVEVRQMQTVGRGGLRAEVQRQALPQVRA